MINVVLYEPEIPENTGNIMRTCAATGTRLHLIKPLGFKLEKKYINRAGAGYIDKTWYKVYENYEDFLNQNKGEFYYFTRYGKKPHDSFDYSDSQKNIYLIFGKESSGIPKEILKDNIDKCMRIPMTKDVRALNLSNCVAVCVYEVLRQQKYKDLLFTEPFKGEDYLEE